MDTADIVSLVALPWAGWVSIVLIKILVKMSAIDNHEERLTALEALFPRSIPQL